MISSRWNLSAIKYPGR